MLCPSPPMKRVTPAPRDNGLEAKLDPAKFIRIHRSVIVNIERIKELHPLFHGEYWTARN